MQKSKAKCFFFFFLHGALFKLLGNSEAVIGVALLPWQQTHRQRAAYIPQSECQC